MTTADLSSDLVDHIDGVGELLRVPREVSLAISVFNIQPNDIHGNVEFVEIGVDVQHVVAIVVIPPTLVIGDGEGWRQRSRAWGEKGENSGKRIVKSSANVDDCFREYSSDS